MSCDLPCISYMALYLVSIHIINTNSRTSTHWKLNFENGKVQTAMAASGEGDSEGFYDDDPLMSILTNKVMDNGFWTLEGNHECSQNCQSREKQDSAENNETTDNHRSSQNFTDASVKPVDPINSQNKSSSSQKNAGNSQKKTPVLSCGKPVNSTQYDHLQGIVQRNSHPSIPEPDVGLVFKKKGKSTTQEIDMNELEKKLRKAKKEKPKSPQVYNQIGNLWRIRGNTQMSIECFRKALALSPNNSDVLLNLARVLYNLEFMDDAIELTQQSLRHLQSPEQNSWLQHFTLGEIFKTQNRYTEAQKHFQLALQWNPNFQPAITHLRDLEINPDVTVTYYTLFIILFLVLGVLCGILTSVDGNLEELGETYKTQRHFNRAMAMRSMKLGINHKVIRMRKQGYNS